MSAGEREVAAQRFAATGWPVFPVRPEGKEPATAHGFQDASTDPDKISWWWRRGPDQNIGIATGAPGPDVLDVDNHGEAGNGFGAINELKRAGLLPTPLAWVRTPSGGFHGYYQGTDQRNGHLVGRRDGRPVARHLDYRARGGYVVAPPSTIGGRRYVVVSKQMSRETFDWKAACQHLEPPEAAPERRSVREAGGPGSCAHLAAWVAALPEGNRNDGMFWAVNRALEAGDDDSVDAIAAAAKAAGFRRVDSTIRSARQRTASPFGRTAEREAEA